MDWKDIAPIVGAVAPTAGKILGGLIPFPGGSLIGEQFGRIIAQTLGVPADPAAVKTALEADTNKAIAVINSATERARIEVDGFVRYEEAVQKTIQTSIEQTNQTMRVELLPENRHWFFTGWRPAAGWTLVVFMSGLGVMILWATVIAIGGKDAALKTMTDAWPLYVSYIAALAALVGVYVIGRSQEKAKAIEVAAPTPVPPKMPLKR